MKVNKTDANDAEGLAHLVRAGWYREVRVKGRSAMLAKALLGARSQLLNMSHLRCSRTFRIGLGTNMAWALGHLGPGPSLKTAT